MILFVGGVRSGKSGLAQSWAERASEARLYIAAGTPVDAEMVSRIEAHRQGRGQGWECLEESLRPRLALGRFLDEKPFNGAILFDCVSAWLANMLAAGWTGAKIRREAGAFFEFLASLPNSCALVSLECGLGFLPMDKLARQYGDLLGMLNQQAARLCREVALVCCGLPLWLKGDSCGMTQKGEGKC